MINYGAVVQQTAVSQSDGKSSEDWEESEPLESQRDQSHVHEGPVHCAQEYTTATQDENDHAVRTKRVIQDHLEGLEIRVNSLLQHTSPHPISTQRPSPIDACNMGARSPRITRHLKTPGDREDVEYLYYGRRHDYSERRCRSEPPPIVRWASPSFGEHVVNGGNRSNAACRATHGSASWGQISTSRKRQRDEHISSSPGTGLDQGPAPKRCRHDILDSSHARRRLHCIFHAGEPDRYNHDTQTYEHISQLM